MDYFTVTLEENLFDKSSRSLEVSSFDEVISAIGDKTSWIFLKFPGFDASYVLDVRGGKFIGNGKDYELNAEGICEAMKDSDQEIISFLKRHFGYKADEILQEEKFAESRRKTIFNRFMKKENDELSWGVVVGGLVAAGVLSATKSKRQAVEKVEEKAPEF